MKRLLYRLWPLWLCVIFLPALLWAGEDGAQNQEPRLENISFPTAKIEGILPDKLVPMDLVNQIALYKARQLWGEVTPGRPVPCCDEQGNISVYMCPFRIGSQPFPQYRDIALQLRNARRETLLLKKKWHDRMRAQNKSARFSRRDFEHFYVRLNEARKKEIGAGSYGAIYVSARYDRYPIILCSHYLPAYYTMGLRAKEKAVKSIGKNAKLTRYYFLGHRGQFLEFTCAGKKATFHAYTLAQAEPGILRSNLMKRQGVKPGTEDQSEDVARVWDELLNRIWKQDLER